MTDRRADQELDALREVVSSALPTVDAGPVVLRARTEALPLPVLEAAADRSWVDRHDADAMRRCSRGATARWVGTRRLLRRLVAAGTTGVAPDEVQVDVRCPRCRSRAHGPSAVRLGTGAPLTMSTSSAPGNIVVGLGRSSIGVDVVARGHFEGMDHDAVDRHLPSAALVRDACGRGIEVAELWTAVEALTKTTSEGLAADEREVLAAVAAHRWWWFPHAGGHLTCVATALASDAPTVVDVDLRAGFPISAVVRAAPEDLRPA